MEIINNILPFNSPATESKKVKKINRRLTHSLEYEVIANLVLQQYEKNDEVNFDLLWTIQPSDRIPALVTEYGNKRMYHLIVTLLKEFCFSFPLPKSKKLNNTRINVCACDLMISAIEEELSIEDFILLFERIKKGKYGPIKKYLTHQIIKEKLAIYLEERSKIFQQLSEKKHRELKSLGPVERICDEPKQIGELLQQASVIEMNKRMSG